jgi:putative ABC transport system permease protein
MIGIWQDLKYGLRTLRRGGQLTAIAVLALAIGIGANTTIFSAVDVFMLRPLPYPQSGDLNVVYTTNRERGWSQVSFSIPDFADFRERSQTLEIAAFSGTAFNLVERDQPERVYGGRLTSNFLQVLGVQPALGRGFTRDEELAGRDHVVLISDGLWRRRFGGDPEVLGTTVLLDGDPYTIVGVMPAGFWYADREHSVWVPLSFSGEEHRNSHYVQALARLKPGHTRAQAADEVERIASQLAADYPETNAGNGAVLITLHEDIFDEGFKVGTTISTIAVLFLLLIACANVANLLLTHAAGRDREVAVRTALGAGRSRIARQFLTEALILSIAGGALGVLLSVFGIRGLVSLMPTWFPRVNEIGLDGRVLLFTAAVTMLSAVLVSLAPLVQSMRSNTVEALKEGGRGGTAVRGARLRKALVIAEVSLALALLVSSALLVQAFYNVRMADRGIDETNVLVFGISLPRQEYPDTPSVVAFHEELAERLSSLPGVSGVGATTILPARGNSATYYWLPGEDIHSDLDRKVTSYLDVTPGYFESLDVPILRGRGFGDQDRPGSRPVIVINEMMAQRHWPAEDPIGRELVFYGGAREIVGVAANTRVSGTSLTERPMVYFAAYQDDDRVLGYMVEASVPLETLVGPVRAQIRAINPHIPAADMRSLSDLIDMSLGGGTIMAKIMAAVGLIALSLSLAGVYGVMAYSVSQRRQEMGIRMALGAQNHNVIGMVLRQGAVLAVIGIVVGLGVAFAMARGLSYFLYGVNAFEPLTYGGVAAALLIAGVAATYPPALRATRVDPVEALRAE